MLRVIQMPDEAMAIRYTGDVGLPEIVALDLECRRTEDGVDVLIVQQQDGEVACHPGDWLVQWTKPQEPKVSVYTDYGFKGNFVIVSPIPESNPL